MAQVGNSQLLGFLHMHNIAAAHTAELLASGFTECYDLHKSLNIKLKWMFTWRSISQISCFRASYSIAHQKPDAWKVLKSTKTLKYSCSNYCESPIHYPLSAKPGSRAIFLLCSPPLSFLKTLFCSSRMKRLKGQCSLWSESSAFCVLLTVSGVSTHLRSGSLYVYPVFSMVRRRSDCLPATLRHHCQSKCIFLCFV